MTKKTRAEVKEKFAGEEYPIHVIGRHLEVTEAMQQYAIEKLIKIERFGGSVIEATISLEHVKQVYFCTYVVTVNRTNIKVTGKEHEFYAAVDNAIDRLMSKLGRYVEKLHSHHAKPLHEVDMHVNVIQGPDPFEQEINDQIEEENLRQLEATMKPGEIVTQKKRPLKMLTTEEAVMKMELTENNFLVYKCEEDQKLKVIYRRQDRNYGIIELPNL
ncbi:MAG: ribosome-associated translation inhibitor RaiA [Chlamydiales bacterium]|nr:ribosome-associated translation inhibitor RaiA [Chlamydiales bacterium]